VYWREKKWWRPISLAALGYDHGIMTTDSTEQPWPKGLKIAIQGCGGSATQATVSPRPSDPRDRGRRVRHRDFLHQRVGSDDASQERSTSLVDGSGRLDRAIGGAPLRDLHSYGHHHRDTIRSARSAAQRSRRSHHRGHRDRLERPACYEGRQDPRLPRAARRLVVEGETFFRPRGRRPLGLKWNIRAKLTWLTVGI